MVIEVKKDGHFVKIPFLSSQDPIKEAPQDNKQYARQNADWSEIIIPEVDLSTIEADIAANTQAISQHTVELSTKVEQESGKGLSTNDYTTAEKTKLAGLPVGSSVVLTSDPRLTPATSSKAGLMTAADKVQLDSTMTSTEIENKINTAISSVYRVKGSVASYANLPTSNVIVGDVYNITDTGANYVAISINPITWDKLSETVDLSPYMLTTTANNTFINRYGDTIDQPLSIVRSTNGTSGITYSYGSVHIIPLSTSNATGISWRTQDNSDIICGIGAHTTGNDVHRLYMGWGNDPYISINNFSVDQTNILYKDKPVYHAGNKTEIYPRYISWIDGNSNKIKEIYVEGDDNTYYPYHVQFDSRGHQIPLMFYLIKALGTGSGNWGGNHVNGTSSCMGVWQFRSNGWDGGGTLFNTITLEQRYARVIGHIEAGFTDWKGLVIWLRGSSNEGGAYYKLATDDTFLRIIPADPNKFATFTVDELANKNSGVPFNTNVDNRAGWNIGKLRNFDTTLTYDGGAVWHANNDGAGSGLDADLLDGIDSSGFVKYDGRIVASNYPVNVCGYGYTANGWISNGPAFTFGGGLYSKQIQGSSNANNLFIRTIENGNAYPWREFAFKDDKSAGTTGTLTINGTAFNGSANVSITTPNTTYNVASTSSNGLMSASDKVKLDRDESYGTASTVTGLDVNKRFIYVTLSSNAVLSMNGANTSYNGRSITAFVYCSVAKTITIPTSGNYVSMCGSSYTCPAGKWVEFNLTCIDGKWHIAKLEQE